MKQILVTLSFLAIFGACSAQSSTADTTNAGDTTVKKHRQYHRRNVKDQEAFTIKLFADMGQGSSWQLVDSSFAEYVVFEKQLSKDNPNSKPGSSSIQIFYFKAIRPGATTIRFIYGRPFQKPLPKDAPRNIYKIIIS
jgi:predicted secreted protein